MTLQTATKVPTLRGCIVSAPGFTFLSLDAIQIELKVAAVLSGDPAMMEDSRSSDMHMATAVRVFGRPTALEAIQHLEARNRALQLEHKDPLPINDEAVSSWIAAETKTRRYNAKQLNFAILYGAEAFKVAQMINSNKADGAADLSEEEAQELIDKYFETYHVLHDWIERTKTFVRQNKYVVNMFGRIRPIPEISAGTWKIRAKAEREAVNTLVQGTASDIIKKMMLYLRARLDKRIKLVLQVHDEILWECPDELILEAIEVSKNLSNAFPDYPCHISVGKIYGEMEELKFNVAAT